MTQEGGRYSRNRLWVHVRRRAYVLPDGAPPPSHSPPCDSSVAGMGGTLDVPMRARVVVAASVKTQRPHRLFQHAGPERAARDSADVAPPRLRPGGGCRTYPDRNHAAGIPVCDMHQHPIPEETVTIIESLRHPARSGYIPASILLLENNHVACWKLAP